MATTSGISASGLGSGLDINGIVNQLMTLERKPLTALDSKEAGYQSKLSAYGSLKSSLSSLQSAMDALASPARFSAVKAALSDSSLSALTADPAIAKPGSYSVEIQTLARAQKLKSTSFESVNDNVGSGTVTIQFGTYANGGFTLNPDKAAKQIIIADDNSSLAAVRDAINSADAGVTASIINDGTGNRLILGSQDTGLSNALRISVSDSDGQHTDTSGLSRLSFDASTGGTQNMTQSVAAQNATLIVDGVTVSKASDIISDVIDGVTLRLSKASPGSPAILSITRDTSTATASVANFVNAFNATYGTVKTLGAYNPETRVAGVLQGDATLRSMQTRLRDLINTPLTLPVGGLTSLSDAGIAFQKDGSLTLDNNRLQKVLADPEKNIASLFASTGKTSDGKIAYTSAGGNVKPGSYGIDISRLATRGTVNARAPANLQISTGLNDQLQVGVDGTSISITIAAGTYSADSLAAEIQSRINGNATLTAAKASVKVSQSGGMLSITSNRYGAASRASIDGGNAAIDLFGENPVSIFGADVEGTIGGISATGTGQALAGSGLSLMVTGGSTGNRGRIDFSQGFASQISKMVAGLLADDGQLPGRVDGINRSIKEIGKSREAQALRLADIEKRYRNQFNALDSMISSMKSTSTYLEQQLANLPGSTNS